MNGRILVPAAAALALAMPATALAKTYTVDPGAGAGCNASFVCKSITDAVNHAPLASGDEIVIKDGKYTADSTIVLDTPRVSVRAENPLKVEVTFSSTDRSSGIPVFSIVDGDVLDGLVISSPSDGGPAVFVKGSRTTVSRSILSKTGISTVDTPVYGVYEDGVTDGVNNINHSSVLSAPSAAGPQESATVQGSSRSSMFLDSVIVFAGAQQGPAVVLPGNDQTDTGLPVPNRIVASVLGATRETQAALAVTSNFDSEREKRTEIDSTVLNGGLKGIGLKVRTGSKGLGLDDSGDINVVAVHTTVAGVIQPFVVDAQSSGKSDDPAGNVNVTFDRSIIRGSGQGTVASRAAGPGFPILAPGAAANTAEVTVRNSDTNQVAAGGGAAKVTIVATTDTPDEQLFQNPKLLNFHLLATAPVLDKGGPVGAGESTLDFDGDPRLNGSATDLGADEFVNHAPTAVGAVAPVSAKQFQPILFDASGSTDPDGPIANYVWNFGDGTTETTTTSYTTHAYLLLGNYFASVTAVDPQGASSTAFQLPQIRVGDGLPPKVAVTAPKAGKTFARYTTKKKKNKAGKVVTTKKFNSIKITGTASDEAGVANAEMQLRRLNLAGKKPNPKVCITTDGKKPMKQTSCKTPKYFRVSFKDGKLSYSLKAAQKLPTGTYEASVRATDKNGNVSAPVVVTFKLK